MNLVTELWAGFVTTDHRPPQHCLLSRDGPPREAAAESIRRTVWTQGCTLGWWGTHRRPGPPGQPGTPRLRELGRCKLGLLPPLVVGEMGLTRNRLAAVGCTRGTEPALTQIVLF